MNRDAERGTAWIGQRTLTKCITPKVWSGSTAKTPVNVNAKLPDENELVDQLSTIPICCGKSSLYLPGQYRTLLMLLTMFLDSALNRRESTGRR